MAKQSNVWAMILKVVHDPESTDLNAYSYENNKYLLGFSCGDLDNEKWYKKNVDEFLAKLDLEKQGLQLTEYSYLNTFTNGETTKYDHEITGQIVYKGSSLKYSIEIFFIDDILSFKAYTQFSKFTDSKEIQFRDCSVITDDSINSKDCYHSLYPIDTIELMFNDPLIIQLNSDESVMHHMDEIVEYCKKKAVLELKSKRSKNKLAFISTVQDQKLYLLGVSDKMSKLTDPDQSKHIYDEKDVHPPLFVIDDEILKVSNIYTATNPVELRVFEIDADPVKPYLINLNLVVEKEKNNTLYWLASISISPNTRSNLDKFNTLYKTYVPQKGTTINTITLFFDDNMKQLIKLGKFKDFKNYLIDTAREKIFQDLKDMENDYKNFYCMIIDKADLKLLEINKISEIKSTSAPDFNKEQNVFIDYDKNWYYAANTSSVDSNLIQVVNENILQQMKIVVSGSPNNLRISYMDFPEDLRSLIFTIGTIGNSGKNRYILSNKDNVDQLIKDIAADSKNSNETQEIKVPV